MITDNIKAKNFRTNLDEYKWDVFFKELQEETPRAAVIIAGAFLDTLLRDLIGSFMIADKKVNELLGTDNNPRGPLSNFGPRILTAYCLGLITKTEFDDLNLIAQIRNKFSHWRHGHNFENQIIVNWCNSLQTPNLFKDGLPTVTDSHQNRYLITVAILANKLGIRILDTQGERRTIRIAKGMQILTANKQ